MKLNNILFLRLFIERRYFSKGVYTKVFDLLNSICFKVFFNVTILNSAILSVSIAEKEV